MDVFDGNILDDLISIHSLNLSNTEQIIYSFIFMRIHPINFCCISYMKPTKRDILFKAYSVLNIFRQK